jgi:hypothetical protein
MLWQLILTALVAVAVSGCVRRNSLVIPPATMAVLPSPLNRQDGDAFVMREPRDLVARVKFLSVHRWGLSITAHAEPAADGTWPKLRIELDGTVTVENGVAIPYWFNFVTEPGFADLKLSLLNGRAGGGPSVVIERLDIVPL